MIGSKRMSQYQRFESKELLRGLCVGAGFREEDVDVQVLGKACVVIRATKAMAVEEEAVEEEPAEEVKPVAEKLEVVVPEKAEEEKQPAVEEVVAEEKLKPAKKKKAPKKEKKSEAGEEQ
jgi:hypothetical protein